MAVRPYVCVFCGSSTGTRPIYSEAARSLGQALARRGYGLVYGGGQIGLMGIIADAVLRGGGRVIGVIPKQLSREEIAHQSLSELHVVPGMHERKAMMAARSAGFLTLPGGIGTYEEFFEVLTWAAIGIHTKPIGLLNVDGYFDPMLRMLDHSVAEHFVRESHVRRIEVAVDPDALLDAMFTVPPPESGPLLETD
ncbi:MAG: TIGR00730 family Rossman fold protein [Isosphaeraceae bacterium]|nr:TIGR00730 family Rossman fold protein [Isosphaeraceae bacterium]